MWSAVAAIWLLAMRNILKLIWRGITNFRRILYECFVFRVTFLSWYPILYFIFQTTMMPILTCTIPLSIFLICASRGNPLKIIRIYIDLLLSPWALMWLIVAIATANELEEFSGPAQSVFSLIFAKVILVINFLLYGGWSDFFVSLTELSFMVIFNSW